MQRKVEGKLFGTSCFLSTLLHLFIAGCAALIYFYIPSQQIEEEPQIIAFEIPSETEPEEIEETSKYLSEVSLASFNNSKDKGLTLYRSSMSRSAVIWFYTKVTGNRDVAIAILTEAEKNNISLSLAFALAYTESKYKVTAVGHNLNGTIDRGLFQLNSNTFPTLTEADFFNPSISAKYGMAHLKQCLKMAGNEITALAMYNAGSGSVRLNRTPQSTLIYISKIISYQKKLDDAFIQEVVSYYETQLIPGITSAFSNDFEKE